MSSAIHWVSGSFTADDMNSMTARLDAANAVLAERERELLIAKGPCALERCRLHYAHSGPCDIR